METMEVDEKKLAEMIDQAVEKRFKQNFEDMEEVRRSPAGAIIRVEGQLASIQGRLDRDMVTRTEFKEANMLIRTDFKDEIWKLKLYLLLLAGLILFTNPTVLELFGKLLGIIK